MDELERALALTGGIYDAALDPALWPEALHGVAEFVGGVAAALVSEDVVARKGGFHFTWGVDPSLIRTYLDKYINLNPVLVPFMLLKVGEAGGGVPDIASVLGLSEPTVRTHLRRLFEKTGARRQADLVRIAGGYSSPLLGPHRG